MIVSVQDHYENAYIERLGYDFLCLFAKLRADSLLLKPHALRARARRVGSPFGFFIPPFIPANLAAKDTRLGFVPDLTGAFKFAPSVRLKKALPFAVKPPFGFLCSFLIRYK